MMKIVVHVFTVYLFALSLVPCSDGGGGIVEMLNHLSGIEHQHFSDHEEHSNGCSDDACSPFCICSCCSSMIDIPEKLPLQIKIPLPSPETTPLFISTIISSTFHVSIWQPPKFC